MAQHIGTMARTGDRFEVMVGEVGWSPEALGTVDGGPGMFERANGVLDDVYGWRPVRGGEWGAVPGSGDSLFVVAVER